MLAFLSIGTNRGRRFFLTLMTALAFHSNVGAQVPLPPAGDSGVIQKSLEKAQPERVRPPAVLPQIEIQDSRTLTDPGAGPSFFVKSILVQGNTLVKYEELADIVALGGGEELTLGLLDLMAQEITALYFRKGYILARTLVPAQTIRDGVVLFQVVEGRLGGVQVTGNLPEEHADKIKRRFAPLLGRPNLMERDLEGPILELNDLVGYKISSVLRPGKKDGTSDLVLEVKKTRPWEFSIDADNFGSEFTGRNRVGVTGMTGNLLRFGDTFRLRALRSGLGQNFVNPNYTVPLNESGTTLGLSYIYSDHQLGGALTALNAGGNSHMATADVLHTLFRSRMAHFYAGAGLDFRFFKNFLQNQTSTDDVLFNAHLFAGGNIRDPLMGQTFLQGRLQFGYTETDRGDPLNSRLQGQGDAVVATFSLTRYQSAYFGGSYFIMKFNGQVTDKRVLSPDQFVLGGIGTVRGYPLADASGDHGYQTTLEYVLPLPIDFPVTTNPRYTFPDLFSLFGFIDHGRIFIEEPQPAERNVSLTSVGGGVRLSVPKGKGHLPGADFSLTYAIPVLGDRKPSDGSLGMVHVAGRLFF